MTGPALRRLPGFLFESRAPVNDEVLPRMDVAIFAGFAASGPVNVPVPVEDAAQFAAVFGVDAPLAWDVELGTTVNAQLGPAVRMFFANGGRRCWVIRVAGRAETTRLPVPGVIDGASGQPIEPLVLNARSPGSWADNVSLSATVTTRRLGVRRCDPANRTLELTPGQRGAVATGDLVHITWRAKAIEMYVGVSAVDNDVVHWTEARWFRLKHELQSSVGRAFISSRRVAVRHVIEPGPPPTDANDFTILLDLRTTIAPRLGEVIVGRLRHGKIVLTVESIVSAGPTGARKKMTYRVSGSALWESAQPSLRRSLGVPTAERLSMDLWARVGGESNDAQRIGEVGLAPGHPRNIGLLPSDASVYGDTEWTGSAAWRDAIAPRFPAAGDGIERLVIPFDVHALPEHFISGQSSSADALTRDGLVPFDARLFIDDELAGSLSTVLLNDAEYIRFLAPRPRPGLVGIHSAIPIEEATMIAVPDAALPGWKAMEKPEPLPPEPPPPAAVDPCRKGDFIDCPAAANTTAPIATTPPAPPAAAPARWRIQTPREYSADVLVAVHRSLLRFCAARRDVMAVLSLPEHYREDAAAAHVRLLHSRTAADVAVGSDADVSALRNGETDALSFGALYQGWVFTRDELGVVRATAPDGAACGVIAQRANARGAWVAPANELWRGVLALERPAAASRFQDLQQLQINVVRQLPRGFAVMNADTLAEDDDVRPINVRRLLILLRRLATRRGALYVFEPNDDSFRRMVQRGFDAMLGDMFRRGAFAGSTAATAFQVVTDDSLNTPQSVDAGRFIVELRVAPSRPMAFLTLRLVQVGERVMVSGA